MPRYSNDTPQVGHFFSKPGYGAPFLITDIIGTKKMLLNLNVLASFRRGNGPPIASDLWSHCPEYPSVGSQGICPQLTIDDMPQSIVLTTAAPLAVRPQDFLYLGTEDDGLWYTISAIHTPRPELISIAAAKIIRPVYYWNGIDYERIQ